MHKNRKGQYGNTMWINKDVELSPLTEEILVSFMRNHRPIYVLEKGNKRKCELLRFKPYPAEFMFDHKDNYKIAITEPYFKGPFRNGWQGSVSWIVKKYDRYAEYPKELVFMDL